MNKITFHISHSKLNIYFFLCGVLMTASEVWKQWYLTFCLNGGIYDWWYFPFQLCSIAMYILLILPWVKNTRLRFNMLSFLMNYSFLGGIAVFADTSGLHYPTFILTLHSYLWHILLITIGISAGIAYIRENKSNALGIKHLRDSTYIYLSCCAVAAIINHLFESQGNINMFYINPDYGMVQIGFSSFVPYIGNIPTIILYILATILGANILFHIWQGISHCYQHHIKKSGTL